MNKKELVEKMTDRAVFEVWQDRPYTAVAAGAGYGGTWYRFFGFSKCRYPDKWNPKYGVELAKKKAIAKIVKEILKDGNNGQHDEKPGTSDLANN